MSDVIVIATARAQKGKEARLVEALREVAKPTREQTGCIRFSLYQSEEQPGEVVGVERWTSKADHDRHLQGPHFQKLGAALGDVVAGPPDIKWYEIVDDEVPAPPTRSKEAMDVVQQYFELWSKKDYQGSRAYLADNLHFQGPFDRFTNADDLIRALGRLGPIVQEIQTKKILSNGSSVCILYDMMTATSIGTVPIVEFFEVSNSKIQSIQALFDPRPFSALFESKAES